MTAEGERSARLESALASVEKKLTQASGSLELLFEKAQLLSLLGEDAAAQTAYVAVLQRDQTHFGALTNLASLALASGHRSAALTAYRQAAEQHPDNPTALVNYAGALLDDEKAAEAREFYERALGLWPAHAEAHQGLARALEALGDSEAAAPHWRAGFAGHNIVSRPYRGHGTAPRVLLLVSIRSGNIPTNLMLDDRMFAVTALYAEFYDQALPLPEHDILFNAIGDADLCGEGLVAACEIAARSGAPTINPPERIIPTGRSENAKRLGQLDGVVAPKVETFSKGVLISAGGAARLAQAGFEFPLLLRAPGFHTGRHFSRVERAPDLAIVAGQMPSGDVLAIQYLDAGGADGLARKYRVMTIDGKFYPVHMAAARDWKVHYVTSDMASRPDLRAEEERFLAAMPEVLGPRAMGALERIRDTLALDYGGVDFAVARDGNLLLFEANATMTILPPGPDPMWDYRRAAIARVLDAARQLVRDRAVLR
ncbi:MAG: tetratricopeptide repeat protein [Rhizomicrobium sp.]